MTAMLGRISIRDWILLLASGWIIAHASWPDGSPVRIISYRTADGTIRQSIVNADDPSVPIIQDRIERWDDRRDSIPMTLARWRRELADFYCRSDADVGPSDDDTAGDDPVPAEDLVAQASYDPAGPTHPSSIPTNQTTRAPAESDRAYWSEVRRNADAWILANEEAAASRRAARGRPPVQVGPIHPGPIGWFGTLASCLIAVMLATGFSMWSVISPPIVLSSGESEIRRTRLQNAVDRSDDLFQVEIPSHWVRVHQPMSVQLRRIAFVSIVMAAIVIQLSRLS